MVGFVRRHHSQVRFLSHNFTNSYICGCIIVSGCAPDNVMLDCMRIHIEMNNGNSKLLKFIPVCIKCRLQCLKSLTLVT